jgi:hypothetical protein
MFSKRMILVAVVIVLVALNVILSDHNRQTNPGSFRSRAGCTRYRIPLPEAILPRFVHFVKNVWNQYFLSGINCSGEPAAEKGAWVSTLQQLNQCQRNRTGQRTVPPSARLSRKGHPTTDDCLPRSWAGIPSPWSKTVIVDKGSPARGPAGCARGNSRRDRWRGDRSVGTIRQGAPADRSQQCRRCPGSAEPGHRGIVKGGGADYLCVRLCPSETCGQRWGHGGFLGLGRGFSQRVAGRAHLAKSFASMPAFSRPYRSLPYVEFRDSRRGVYHFSI